MKLSFIIPSYNEAENLPEVHRRVSDVVLGMAGVEAEIIFVDDGSSDRTAEVLAGLKSRDSRVEVVRFARNFGSHAAIAAGLKHCRGEAAIVQAADLQDPPETVPRMLEAWRGGAHTVWAVRSARRGEPLLNRAGAAVYYALMSRLIRLKLPPRGADFFLVDRRVINAVNACTESNTSIILYIAWLGFRQASIEYVKERRRAGASKWSFLRRVKLFTDSVISFSYAPLRLMSAAGAALTLSGIAAGAVWLASRFTGAAAGGFPGLACVILFVGGLQILSLGLLGEYLWRAFDETRARPRYVIQEKTFKS